MSVGCLPQFQQVSDAYLLESKIGTLCPRGQMGSSAVSETTATTDHVEPPRDLTSCPQTSSSAEPKTYTGQGSFAAVRQACDRMYPIIISVSTTPTAELFASMPRNGTTPTKTALPFASSTSGCPRQRCRLFQSVKVAEIVHRDFAMNLLAED